MDATSLYLGRKLIERIKEQQEIREPFVLSGHAQDFADYKFRCGFLEGMNQALKWLEELTLEDEGRGPFARAS